VSARLAGPFPAVVTDNRDPQALGRLRVRVPEVLGDVETGWCLPAVPTAGDGVGLYAVPAVGALVHVLWTAGDTSRPAVWLGAAWSSGGGIPGADPDRFQLVTPSGSRITVSDVAGEERIELSHEGSGATVVLDAQGIELRHSAAKVVLSGASVSINDGALEVI
jgi:uncharacterized protein involved in type VI secretion and phage assembly